MENNCICISDLAKSRCRHYYGRQCNKPTMAVELQRVSEARRVLEVTNNYFNTDIRKRSRQARDFVYPRMFYVMYTRSNLRLTYVEIGSLINRNHASVMHAERKMVGEILVDRATREKYECYQRALFAKLDDNYSRLVGMIQELEVTSPPETLLNNLDMIMELKSVVESQMRGKCKLARA
jgi:hypothetical protein